MFNLLPCVVAFNEINVNVSVFMHKGTLLSGKETIILIWKSSQFKNLAELHGKRTTFLSFKETSVNLSDLNFLASMYT